MNLKTRVNRIRKILRERYPEVKTPLSYETPFQLLVATILSAQCTDQQVNRVTEKLFDHLKTPSDFAQAPLKTIEEFIRPTGFFHNKAKNIFFGRETCTARKPKCPTCPLNKMCPWKYKTT